MKYTVYYTFYDGQECPANLRQYEMQANSEIELDAILNTIQEIAIDILIKEVE